MRGNVQVFRAKAGDSQGDAIGILSPALDVEGRVIIARVVADLILQQVEQAVETHGRAAIGGKIETVHRNKSPSEQFESLGPAARRHDATPSRRVAAHARYALHRAFQDVIIY